MPTHSSQNERAHRFGALRAAIVATPDEAAASYRSETTAWELLEVGWPEFDTPSE